MASNALYISIYQELLHDIQSGKYIENEPLPSEESLCRSYNVSRTTVHKALDMLKDADVVYSVQGNGAYVKPHMFAQPLSKFYSFTDSLKSINILIQNEIIDCTIVRADKGLSVPGGDGVSQAYPPAFGEGVSADDRNDLSAQEPLHEPGHGDFVQRIAV